MNLEIVDENRYQKCCLYPLKWFIYFLHTHGFFKINFVFVRSMGSKFIYLVTFLIGFLFVLPTFQKISIHFLTFYHPNNPSVWHPITFLFIPSHSRRPLKTINTDPLLTIPKYQPWNYFGRKLSHKLTKYHISPLPFKSPINTIKYEQNGRSVEVI